MNGTPEQGGWRAAPGWMKLTLAVSLALNLAVAGLIGGHAVREWRDPSFVAARPEPGLDGRQTRILHMVPEARRETARAILLARRDEIDRARAVMLEANLAFIAAMRQEPLDPVALEQALARRNAASGEFWRIGMEQVVEIARALGPVERVELADRIEERTKRWMARWERREK